MSSDSDKLDRILKILTEQSEKIEALDESIKDLPQLRDQIRILSALTPVITLGKPDKPKKSKKSKKSKKPNEEELELPDDDSNSNSDNSDSDNSDNSMAVKKAKKKSCKEKVGKVSKARKKSNIVDSDNEEDAGMAPIVTTTMMSWLVSVYCNDTDFFRGIIPDLYFKEAENTWTDKQGRLMTDRAKNATMISLVYDVLVKAEDTDVITKIKKSYNDFGSH